MPPVITIASFQPRPERAADVEAALRAAVRAAHTEEGCQLYALHRTVSEPVTLVMVEQWSGPEALGAHVAGDAVRAVLATLKDGLAKAPEVLRLAPLPEGDAKLGQIVP